MKIVNLIKTFFPYSQGGSEEVVLSLAKEFISHGHDVSVLTCNSALADSTEYFHEGISCKAFPTSFSILSSPFSLALIRNINNILLGADVLVVHGPWPQLDIILPLLPRSMKIVFFYHADAILPFYLKPVEWFYNKINRRTLSFANSIICTSPNYFNSSKYLKSFHSKVSVIPLGVDVNISNNVNLSSIQNLLDRYGLNDCKYIYFVGAMRGYKGLEFLIDAANITKLPVVISGYGKAFSRLKKSANNNVIFTGHISNFDRDVLLRHCRFFVLPSVTRAEAFGVVLLEASRFGKPMITTELGTGTSYVNLAGESGLVVEPRNAHVLARSFDLLFNDDMLIEKYSNGARIRVVKYFDIKKIAEMHLKLFESLN